MKVSPCMRCQRVPEPETCENKECLAWRKWFARQWEEVRRIPRLEKEAPGEPEGLVIGGVRYALPHRVRAYLTADPCDDCRMPRDLCKPECRAKRHWLQARKTVGKGS